MGTFRLDDSDCLVSRGDCESSGIDRLPLKLSQLLLIETEQLASLTGRPFHLLQLALHCPELPLGNEGVCDCRKHYDEGTDYVGLSVSSASLESLPPSTFQRYLLLLAGILLMGVGGFSGICILIFDGSRRDGIVAGLLLIVGSILFFHGVQ
jgi:hypothetical protein